MFIWHAIYDILFRINIWALVIKHPKYIQIICVFYFLTIHIWKLCDWQWWINTGTINNFPFNEHGTINKDKDTNPIMVYTQWGKH